MKKFEVTILGCAAAKPSKYHHPSSQIVNYDDKMYMVDCGEGTQTQLQWAKISPSRIHHIFITHFHGDHVFGLYGLLSTLSLVGRTDDMHLYVPMEIKDFIEQEIKMQNHTMTYKVIYHGVNTSEARVIYEDKDLEVETIPLSHGCPCCGFLFREKPQPPHLDKEACDRYGVPIKQLRLIKEGKDFTTDDGTVIPNSMLTTDADPQRSYAYCCDTAPQPQLKHQLKDVSLLCHEATFLHSQTGDLSERGHSTARQAAQMASLYGAKELLITHLSTMYDGEETRLLEEAQTVFPSTILAKEMLVVPVKA